MPGLASQSCTFLLAGSTLGPVLVPAAWPSFPLMPEMSILPAVGILDALTGACCLPEHLTSSQSCTVLLQGASWSGLDFGGHWRLLHYSLKRIFAPVLVSAYLDREDSSVHVWVVSDMNRPVTGKPIPDYIRLSCFVAPLDSSVLVCVVSNLNLPDTGAA